MMKPPRVQTNKKLIFTVVGLGFGLAFMGNACSKDFVPIDQSSFTNEAAMVGSGATVAPNDFAIIPGAKTVSVVYSSQILDQMTNCLGVIKPSEITRQMYDDKKGAISVYGSPTTITSPMLMAITSIAGEVCNDLIDQEQLDADRKVFLGFELSKTTSTAPDSSMLSDAAKRLVLSCWNRQPTSDELTKLIDLGNAGIASSSTASGDATAGRKAALLMCTAVISSLDALLN
jgi:hypothetical protein